MRSAVRRMAVFVVVFVLSAGFDQASKQWALELPTPAGCDVAGLVAHTCHGTPTPVIDGHWDWELAMNTGAAFSSFDHGRAWQIALSLLALVAVGAIGFVAWRTPPQQRITRVALALLAGGALGNLIDRLRHGGVVDFVRWKWGDHRWPIFNVADVALVVGVLLLFVASWTERRAPTETAKPAGG